MDVLLDTNFIAAAVQSKARVREQLERDGSVRFVVLSSVLKEVDGLPPREAKAAKTFLASEKFEVVESKGDTDDAILKLAKTTGAAVATLDQGLKKRLKKARVQVITLSRNKIVFS